MATLLEVGRQQIFDNLTRELFTAGLSIETPGNALFRRSTDVFIQQRRH